MKVALYIEDGLEQIVLTPDSDAEKMVLAKLQDSSRTIEIKHGSFYACRGGWTRQGQNDDSTMIVLNAKPSAPTTEGQG